MTLYQQLFEQIAALIREGTLKAAERVPSVREMAKERGVSLATVTHAYELLEDQGFIETRPRSGFFVGTRWRERPRDPESSRPSSRSTRVDVSELVFQVLDATRNRNIVPLGSAFPSPLLYPLRQLARFLGDAARTMDPWSTIDDLPPGSLELRRQIARRYLRSGAQVSPDEIIITSGALEALNLSLQALTRPGDLIAVESPAFYGCLQAIETMGLRAVEIPTHPREGVNLGALAEALAKHPIRACWLMTNFQNPFGALVPDEARRELVHLLEKHDVPLIEDDVYSELYFGARRPRATLAFSRKGLVVHCSSFSKSLAPGYRVGWVTAGRFAREIQQRKVMSTLATSIPVQNAMGAYLRHGGFDRHLKQLRTKLANQQQALLRSLRAHLPNGSRVTEPQGGYFLWVELPEGADAIEIHRLALERGFSVAPGPMFSARRTFRNCIRLNYGHPWTPATEAAVRALGQLTTGRRGN